MSSTGKKEPSDRLAKKISDLIEEHIKETGNHVVMVLMEALPDGMPTCKAAVLKASPLCLIGMIDMLTMIMDDLKEAIQMKIMQGAKSNAHNPSGLDLSELLGKSPGELQDLAEQTMAEMIESAPEEIKDEVERLSKEMLMLTLDDGMSNKEKREKLEMYKAQMEELLQQAKDGKKKGGSGLFNYFKNL